ATAAGDSVRSRLARFFGSGNSDGGEGADAAKGTPGPADKASVRNADPLSVSPQRRIPLPDRQLQRMDEEQKVTADDERAVMRPRPRR
ncbi:MAG: hypothetical protein K2G17_06375, partial [Duncaniella sp.]|nr:hypothetical protein [Duncaniella sp.]